MKLRQRLAATTWASQDFDSSQIGIHPDSIQSINTAKVLQVCIKFQLGFNLKVSSSTRNLPGSSNYPDNKSLSSIQSDLTVSIKQLPLSQSQFVDGN